MRGASKVGGKAFKLPKERLQQLGEVLDVLDIGELPVAPALEPINDRWSISNFNEPVDARDCTKYPASPYCENEFIEFGAPFGVTLPEIKSNGCETCFYVYPIIMWMKLQPTIICHRNPNCDIPKPSLNKDPLTKNKPARYNENVPPSAYKSPECAFRESILNAWHNWHNDQTEAQIKNKIEELTALYPDVKLRLEASDSFESGGFPDPCTYLLSSPYSIGGATVYFTQEDIKLVRYIHLYWEYTFNGSQVGMGSLTREYRAWIVGRCCGMPSPPKVIPPPPLPIIPETRKKRGKDMCCNDCADAKDNTDRLLKEIKEIKKVLGTGKLEKALNAAVGIGDDSITAIVNLIAKRIGTSSYPIEVPESLLTGTDDGKVYKAESNAEYLFWLTKQLDGLVGEFPIKIEIQDADPIKEGDQKLQVEIPNIAEAIAEIYGLTFKSSVNQEVELNMLLRLALETIQTKNAAIVAQEYARGNAQFLGYEGNTKGREIDYNFDLTDVNVTKKNQSKGITLESLLKNSKGWVVGWENNDKETVVGFLRKLMFSAGIIKAVFFRNKKQSKALAKNIEFMANDAKQQDKDWEQFLKDINDPNSRYNTSATEKPEIDEDKGGRKS